MATYAWEIGTAFFESCASFEGSVLPAGLAMLRAAAKLPRAPYLPTLPPYTESSHEDDGR